MHEQFLSAIAANPADDGPRWMYADWLSEQADPRGEFIRVQLQLAALREGRPPHRGDERRDHDEFEYDDSVDVEAELAVREATLQQEYGDIWLGDLPTFTSKQTFRRGFVEFVELTGKDFARHADRLFTHPVRTVWIHEAHLQAFEIAACSQLELLDGLCLSGQFTPDSMQHLLGTLHLSKLQRLLMPGALLEPDSCAEVLASSMALGSLRMIDLSQNGLHNRGVKALVESPICESLEYLILESNQIRLLGARAIAKSTYLDELRYLNLRNNPLSGEGVDIVRKRFGRSICDV
ncbi:MAG: TIGR02996 domain-containing protein [Pirellulaceae bacterium]|jgi:uncharacterized protein (TIGR02996 family)|nr:TIGR02996 domain-containing protein [Pirellulaceae bacterium]MDP7019773.1 TIGR02996 domain-containing protein [Pirellulaceae bacterium]